MKGSFLITILLLTIITLATIYFLFIRKKSKKTGSLSGLSARFEYYKLGDSSAVIPLEVTFTTPASYGDGASSFTGLSAYIVDCGTSSCIPDVQPVHPTDAQLSNQEFIDLTNKSTFVIKALTGLNTAAGTTIINIKGDYTVGHTYSVGIALINDKSITGDFAYTTVILNAKKGPGIVSELNSNFTN